MHTHIHTSLHNLVKYSKKNGQNYITFHYKNALDRGWTDRISLLHDLDLDSPPSCGHDQLTCKSWRSTLSPLQRHHRNRRTEALALPPAVMQLLDMQLYIYRIAYTHGHTQAHTTHATQYGKICKEKLTKSCVQVHTYTAHITNY